jgi:hypothetical protein
MLSEQHAVLSPAFVVSLACDLALWGSLKKNILKASFTGGE